MVAADLASTGVAIGKFGVEITEGSAVWAVLELIRILRKTSDEFLSTVVIS